MIVIDAERIFSEIRRRRPVSVAINGPDGILPQVQDVAEEVTRRFGIPAYVLADTTWGTCDLNQSGARTLAADLLFNVGHTVGIGDFGDDTILVDAFDDISFDPVVAKCVELLRGRTVSLLTDSQHLNQVRRVRDALEEGGVRTRIGRGRGQLDDGQVFGCEFYPAMEKRESVDANVFLGQSNFHAAGVALSTNLPTYVLDPYFNEIREVSDFAAKLQRKAVLAVYKASEARSFGVVVGLKEGQLSKGVALKFVRELRGEDRRVQLFALTDITNERLRNLRGVEAFIQVACPRISTDNRFDMPVLSTPQGMALLRVLRGESIEGFLQIPHWL